jgi:hypothetical protein
MKCVVEQKNSFRKRGNELRKVIIGIFTETSTKSYKVERCNA